MGSKFRLRFIFRPIIKLLARTLIRIGVTPNLATFIMLSFSLLSFISLVFFRSLLYFSIFVFLCGLFDGVDGAIARLTSKSTKYGGFLDSFMDRISEFFIFIALLIFYHNRFLWNFIDIKWIIFISLLASLMISYSRARAEIFFKENFFLDGDIGLMGRSERLFYIFITMLCASFLGFALEFLFIYMCLVICTFMFRLTKIYYQIKQRDNKQTLN
ncbi:MAG: CDP-alcohol phosphatidyltransferase family protein [Promethearchaeota archaeon]